MRSQLTSSRWIRPVPSPKNALGMATAPVACTHFMQISVFADIIFGYCNDTTELFNKLILSVPLLLFSSNYVELNKDGLHGLQAHINTNGIHVWLE